MTNPSIDAAYQAFYRETPHQYWPSVVIPRSFCEESAFSLSNEEADSSPKKPGSE
jgi:hypothetical protein